MIARIFGARADGSAEIRYFLGSGLATETSIFFYPTGVMIMRRGLVIALFVVSCLWCIVPDLPAADQGQRESALAADKHDFASPLAGTWYDADPVRLTAAIDDYMNNVPDQPAGPVCALILPHAGLDWSGQTAAYGIKQLKKRDIRRVILLGPSHHAFFPNSASLPDVTHYSTPLGETPLDVDLITELLESSYFQVIPQANKNEHSVQVLLPLLQRELGEFSFVPIVLGMLDIDSAKAIAAALRSHLDPYTLVIASSDFTHYGRNFSYLPFTSEIPENLEKLDMGAFRFIEDKNLQGFADYVEETGATICGRAAIEVLLALLPETSSIQLLHYETSGAKTHDYYNSVSYVTAAVSGSWTDQPENVKGAGRSGQGELSSEDKARLMALAKGTLKYYLENGSGPTPEQLGVTLTPGMKQTMGAFVTLKEHGFLRGCIGEITPVRPLYEAVMGRVIDSAVHDPRFSAVRAEEYQDLRFEISALTPSQPIASYQDIVLGRDGVVLQKDGKSAVFLPQVAPEQGWGLEEMLAQLAMKAGLPADGWKEGASFTVFQAIVFGEDDK